MLLQQQILSTAFWLCFCAVLNNLKLLQSLSMCSCVFVLPGHGQCYCGNCYCAAGWHGDKCEFQCDISPWESRRRCTSPDGKICSNRGLFTYTFHISAYITLILFSHLTDFSLFLGFCKQLHTFTACFLAFQFSKYNGETTIHFFFNILNKLYKI